MLAVFGLLLWGLAAFLAWTSRESLGRAAERATTRTSTVAALQEVGPGSFTPRVELQGTVRCPQPLLGERSQQRTLGARAVERAFPLDVRVCVLGEASDVGGTLRIHRGPGEVL